VGTTCIATIIKATIAAASPALITRLRAAQKT
jgi:hypothetical protein